MTDTSPASDVSFATECLRRTELYRWFAGLLSSRLDPALLSAYRKGPGRAVLDNLGADPALRPGAARMEAALDVAGDDGTLARTLGRDFTALFENGRVSPRASDWHRDGEAAAEAGEGAGAGNGDGDGDVNGTAALIGDRDHVAVLLDLMAQMVEAGLDDWRAAGGSPTGAAMATSWRRQARFLDRHLLSWLPAFRDACAEHDPDGFYAGVAMLVTSYVLLDRALVAEAVAACAAAPPASPAP